MREGFILCLCYTEIMKELFNTIIATLLTSFIYLVGGIDVAMACLLIAIIIDYVSGIIKAFITKQLSSKTGFKGVVKKVACLLVVMLAVLVDHVTGNTGAVRTLVIYYFVANEGLSIIENLSQAGVPVPQSIKKTLRVMKKENK